MPEIYIRAWFQHSCSVKAIISQLFPVDYFSLRLRVRGLAAALLELERKLLAAMNYAKLHGISVSQLLSLLQSAKCKWNILLQLNVGGSQQSAILYYDSILEAVSKV